MIFVDGPDGVGKTGYSHWISDKTGIPRLEMRPVENTHCIEEKSKVFNAALRDLHDQDVDLVIDRGSVSSIVYSRVFDRGRTDHAWDTLDYVRPLVIYLRCDADELVVRYEDELFDSDDIRELATTYDDVMSEVDDKTGAVIVQVDTTAQALETIETALNQHAGNMRSQM